MGRKVGRKPKYRTDSHTGPAQDFGPAEIWNKSVVVRTLEVDMPLAVRALGAETIRHGAIEAVRGGGTETVLTNYVLRNRTVSEGGVVVGAGVFNQIQCPLDALRLGGFLGDDEQAKRRAGAGEALYELYKNASIEGRTTATWNSAGGGGLREQEDWSAEDEMRYHRAIKAIRPYDALVMAVCVQHVMPPGRRKALDVLITGLDLLDAWFEKPRTTSSRHEKRVG